MSIRRAFIRRLFRGGAFAALVFALAVTGGVLAASLATNAPRSIASTAVSALRS